MKFSALISVFLILTLHSINTLAGDVYAEYKMNGAGGRTFKSGMYFKDGDMRTDVKMDIAGKEMTTVTLYLKSNPDVILSYNNHSKTYTEIKKQKSSAKQNDISISVI